MAQSIPRRILPIIVFAQFAGTSLWFAGNAVIPDLVQELQLTDMAVGYITSGRAIWVYHRYLGFCFSQYC